MYKINIFLFSYFKISLNQSEARWSVRSIYKTNCVTSVYLRNVFRMSWDKERKNEWIPLEIV